jgi:hypothetical protein
LSKVTAFVEEYDKKIFYSMLLKCHHHLSTPLVKKIVIVHQGFNKYSSLDIFEMTTNRKELAKELVNSEFLILKRF